MGLKPSNNDDDIDHPKFSSMVLKIELSGPENPHFAILDLPGVFSAAGANKVTPSEMQGVSEMVRKYMLKPENIIM